MDNCGKDCVFSVINTVNTGCDLVFYSRKYKMLAYKLCGVRTAFCAQYQVRGPASSVELCTSLDISATIRPVNWLVMVGNYTVTGKSSLIIMYF
jgi:hypothetical protein